MKSSAIQSPQLYSAANCPSRNSCVPGQPPGEEHDGGGVEEGLGRGDGRFEVLGEPPIAIDPGKEAFDDPPPWQHLEADLVGDLPDDFDRDDGGVPDPLGAIGAVGEGDLHEGMVSPGSLQEGYRAVSVLDVGRMGLDSTQPAAVIAFRWR